MGYESGLAQAYNDLGILFIDEANYELIIPQDFNFAYDVVDGWAAQNPHKRALLWTNDQGECRT